MSGFHHAFAKRVLDESARWMRRGACVGKDPELWFPGRGESHAAAKAVCDGCEVRAECLEYALDSHERFGIWGGLSERQRRQIVRQRAIARRRAS